MAVVLVAQADQQELLQAICSRIEIAGVFNPSRAHLAEAPVPVLADRTELMARARICCFLFPYPDLKQDLITCLEQGIHVLSAGPVAFSRRGFDLACQLARQHRLNLHLGGRHLFSLLFQTFSEQSRKPAFGNPVYLRHVRGGGNGLLPAWWATCEALALAQSLLSSNPQKLYITASRKGRQHHVALTGAMDNKANTQLVVAPVHPPLHHDIILLGSGGMLSSDTLANAPLLMGQNHVELQPHPALYPEPDWLLDFLGQLERPEPVLPDWSALNLQHRLLRTIRKSLRQQQPLQIALR